MGGGPTFRSGPSFARVRYMYIVYVHHACMHLLYMYLHVLVEAAIRTYYMNSIIKFAGGGSTFCVRVYL